MASGTTVPGGTDTTGPAGTETTAPGGTDTTATEGTEITAPGGTDTTATEGTEITAQGGNEVRSEFAPFNGAGESTHCPTDLADLERNKANVGGRQRVRGVHRFRQHVRRAVPGPQRRGRAGVRRMRLRDHPWHPVRGTDVFGERGSKVVDIFRLDEEGKIVEHWDVLSPIAETSLNGNPEV